MSPALSDNATVLANDRFFSRSSMIVYILFLSFKNILILIGIFNVYVLCVACSWQTADGSVQHRSAHQFHTESKEK